MFVIPMHCSASGATVTESGGVILMYSLALMVVENCRVKI